MSRASPCCFSDQAKLFSVLILQFILLDSSNLLQLSRIVSSAKCMHYQFEIWPVCAMQAKAKGVVASDCTHIAELESLQSSLHHCKQLLAAFSYAAEDTVHTWTVDSLTHSKPPAQRAVVAKTSAATALAAHQAAASSSRSDANVSSSPVSNKDLLEIRQLCAEQRGDKKEYTAPSVSVHLDDDAQASCLADLLAAGDLHKENDDRFNAITQAFQRDATHRSGSGNDIAVEGQSDRYH